eukprot:1987916-Prymnesium_polylepis.2
MEGGADDGSQRANRRRGELQEPECRGSARTVVGLKRRGLGCWLAVRLERCARSETGNADTRSTRHRDKRSGYRYGVNSRSARLKERKKRAQRLVTPGFRTATHAATQSTLLDARSRRLRPTCC